MAKLLGLPAVVLVAALLLFSPMAPAQQGGRAAPKRPSGSEYDSDFPNERPLSAPVRDISGIWETAKEGAGTQAKGAQLFPSPEDGQLPANGRPQGEPPYT